MIKDSTLWEIEWRKERKKKDQETKDKSELKKYLDIPWEAKDFYDIDDNSFMDMSEFDQEEDKGEKANKLEVRIFN